jgi:ribonuclease HII
MLAGVDEVGRGPLAGPVVTAAVILSPEDPMLGQYRDSKALSENRRLKLYRHLRRYALAYGLGMASVEEIDRLNILQATLLAMRRSVDALSVEPTRVLVDGNRLPRLVMPAAAIIGGDSSIQEIAAASIMAKVVRDRMMRIIHAQFPDYGFVRHKGYGTAEHLDALREHGPCIWHRKSFAPVAHCLPLAGGNTL